MPFPLRVGITMVESGPELVRLIERDTAEHALVPETPPHRWVLDLRNRDFLTEDELRALTAALIQRSTPASTAVGIRLALHLNLTDFGTLLLSAMGGMDMGTLLTVDPLAPDQSIEDTLLDAIVTLCNLEEPATRAEVLGHLRHAGHHESELLILTQRGSAAEVRQWLPAVLAQTLPTDWLAHVLHATRRSAELNQAIQESLRDIPEERRNAVLAQVGH